MGVPDLQHSAMDTPALESSIGNGAVLIRRRGDLHPGSKPNSDKSNDQPERPKTRS